MKWTKTLTCLLLAASIAGSGLGLLSGPDALADEGTDPAAETPAAESEPAAVSEPSPEPKPEQNPESETPETPSEPSSDTPSDTSADTPPDDENQDVSDPKTENSENENTESNPKPAEQPETESVTLAEAETGITMTVDGTYELTPIVSPEGIDISWSVETTSGDGEVVTLTEIENSQNVTLTAVAPGKAVVTAATPSGKTASCTVVVNEPPKDVTITLNQTDISLLAGKTRTLKATVISDDENEKTVTWSSSNQKVASVDQKGCITAHKAGTAVITASTPSGAEATCTVNVTELGTIKLNYKQYSLRPGGKILLHAAYSPKSYSVTWSSSDKRVATVNSSGLVTAVSAGTATITAALESGESTSCKITVMQSSYPSSSGWYSSLFGSSLFGPTSQYTMPDNIPKNVALTFDCTLGTHTDTVLDALYLYDSFATFFVKSKDIYRKDDRVRRIVGEGHTIGITLTAEELTSADTALAALTSANSKLSTVCGVPTRLVTVEGGSTDNISQEVYDALRENGYRIWDWDYQVDETESTSKAAEALEEQLDTTKRVVVRMNTRRRSIQTLETVLGYMRFANMPTRALADSDKPVCQFTQIKN